MAFLSVFFRKENGKTKVKVLIAHKEREKERRKKGYVIPLSERACSTVWNCVHICKGHVCRKQVSKSPTAFGVVQKHIAKSESVE